jgi:hypothetical protein
MGMRLGVNRKPYWVAPSSFDFPHLQHALSFGVITRTFRYPPLYAKISLTMTKRKHLREPISLMRSCEYTLESP